MSRLFNLDFQLLHDSLLTLVAVFVLFLGGSFFFFNPARENRELRMMLKRPEKKKKMQSVSRLNMKTD